MMRKIALSMLTAASGLFAIGSPPLVKLPPLHVSTEVPLLKVDNYRMQLGRFAPAVVADGHYLYIIGGQSAGGAFLRSVERFDVVTGRSEEFAELKQGRCWHRAVLHRGKIYVLGGVKAIVGVDEDILASVEVVDLATRKVSAGVDLPFARHQFGCVVVGDDLYVIGGATGRKPEVTTDSVQVYSFLTGSWRDEAPISQPRECQAVCALLGSRSAIFVPGGYHEVSGADGISAPGDGKSREALATIEAFDLSSRSWLRLPAMRYPISAAALVALGHDLFFFGDYAHPDQLYAYDLRSGAMEAYTLDYKPARHAAATVLDGKIYVVGGRVRREQTDSRDFVQVYAPRPRTSPGS